MLPMAGLLGVCFYNLIYTPLKRRTILAIVPGAVCGVLPILMGWMAAGGGLASPKVWILVVIFGVWQLPHFWLVVLANRRDYRSSGIPNMLGILSVRQLRKLVFVWVGSFVVLTLLWGWVVGPAIAWLIIKVIPLAEAHAAGLLLISLAPTAPFYPVMVRMARGDMSFAGSLMLLTTVGTVVFLPLMAPVLIEGNATDGRACSTASSRLDR